MNRSSEKLIACGVDPATVYRLQCSLGLAGTNTRRGLVNPVAHTQQLAEERRKAQVQLQRDAAAPGPGGTTLNLKNHDYSDTDLEAPTPMA